MAEKAKCRSCKASAVLHVTDALRSPASTSHSCERHGREVYAQAIRQIINTVGGTSEPIEAAATFIARELVLPKADVVEKLTYLLNESQSD